MTSQQVREKVPFLAPSATHNLTASSGTSLNSAGRSPEPIGGSSDDLHRARGAAPSSPQPVSQNHPSPSTHNNNNNNGAGPRFVKERLKPELKFKTGAVRRLTSQLLEERLRYVAYEPYRCKALGEELAAVILDRVKALGMHRYKTVVVVSIGSNSGKAGIQFGARCLWDQDTDSFLTVKFANRTLFAVAMVYGLYYQ